MLGVICIGFATQVQQTMQILMCCGLCANTVKHEEMCAAGSFFDIFHCMLLGFSQGVFCTRMAAFCGVSANSVNTYEKMKIVFCFCRFHCILLCFPKGAVCTRIVAFRELMRHVQKTMCFAVDN